MLKNNFSKLFLLTIIFITILINNSEINGQVVSSWITSGDQSNLLQSQSTVNFTANTGAKTITFNTGTTYQEMDGFGFCLTQGSAEVINSLNAGQQTTLLNDLFSPSGIGMTVIRISIGASDLSGSNYSYNDIGPDPTLANFSLAGPDLTHVIPLLQKILLINPNIKILATPWSPPRWMKTNNNWIGGSLNPSYYAAYANYFVKYINAMQAQGITIWAITPQNEPENPWNEPSMEMTATEQENFINNNLGPAIQGAGLATKIIAFDHNCDNTAYPTQVCNNSTYVDGAAFHLYAGSINALSTVHTATGKNIYFTEQYTDSGGNFWGDFAWHTQNVMIGSTTNWAKIALEWNLATNSGYGPRTPGGCTDCLGGVTVNSPSSYTINVSYYIVAQFSKFVKPGAVRIQTTSSDGQLKTVGFKNTDGKIVIVAYNDNNGSSKNITVGDGTKRFNYTIPRASAVSFVWNDVPLPIELLSFSATMNNDKSISLVWSTGQEKNNDVIIIERSTNGIHFDSIATIQSNNSNNSVYRFTDEENLTGVQHYRLKLLDFNNTIYYSKIETVYPKSYSEKSFILNPNPTEGNNFKIKYSIEDTEAEITVNDLLGNVIYRKKIPHSESIFDGNSIPIILKKGVYLISISGSNFKEKLIIQ